MYGMVNKAIVDMVHAQFGSETWEAIRLAADIDEDLFLSMSQYPDDVTYRLVGAASQVLKIPAEEVLHAFGRYWVTYTAREGYGELLRVSGHNIWEFLANLDNMHARVALSFPRLRPPSFRCTDVHERGLKLHYRSERIGLTHLVVGLLQGLGEMFGTAVRVEVLPPDPAEPEEDIFAIQYADSAA
jgi:hypothetical protein